MDILDFIRSDGYITVSKSLAHEIGTVEAIIYCELVSLSKYWGGRGELVDGKWFFCTADNLEKNTALKRKPQDRSIAKLEKLGLIETKKMGLPAKKYFYITDRIYNLFDDRTNKNVQNGQADNGGDLEAENIQESRSNQIVQNGQTRMSKTDKQECPKQTANKNNLNNNKLNNKKERENIIKNAEIDEDLKKYIAKRTNEFETQGIDLKTVLNWIEKNKEFYNYVEFTTGVDQLLTFPETVGNPILLLRKTFDDIDYYVEAAKKKQMKKADKQLAEEKKQLVEAATITDASTKKVQFYNWLEDRN